MNCGMTYSKTGLQLTESFESCPLKSYQDIGRVWTIAYGHTRGVGPGLTCIQAQAVAWVNEDAGFCEAAVNDLVIITLTQGEFDGLVDFCINCGIEAFKGSTMLRLLNDGNREGAAAEFDKWDHVQGKVCAGLLRRREAERQEFTQGAD
jgi:lysozyme